MSSSGKAHLPAQRCVVGERATLYLDTEFSLDIDRNDVDRADIEGFDIDGMHRLARTDRLLPGSSLALAEFSDRAVSELACLQLSVRLQRRVELRVLDQKTLALGDLIRDHQPVVVEDAKLLVTLSDSDQHLAADERVLDHVLVSKHRNGAVLADLPKQPLRHVAHGGRQR